MPSVWPKKILSGLRTLLFTENTFKYCWQFFHCILKLDALLVMLPVYIYNKKFVFVGQELHCQKKEKKKDMPSFWNIIVTVWLKNTIVTEFLMNMHLVYSAYIHIQ